LARWRRPNGKLISPATFIPVAEQAGLIDAIGMQILEAACEAARSWQLEGYDLTVAVNVSPSQFQRHDLTEAIMAMLRRTGLHPNRLELEITESMLLDGREAVISKMARLKGHGIRFSLDDFGTGYSSLSYLKTLPLDQLKIDRSFVCDLMTDPLDADIARTIVTLAHALNLDVIAEGVETLEQSERLSSYGCTRFQGYYFGRPMPLEQLLAAMTAKSR
jgi:EAL domain-containing protein (putative c-di-GMP-specific phosphodiesterase class I)